MNQGKMLLVNHGCQGMRGTSGSPLICHDTGGAIGVFLGTVSQYHQAVATETVIEFLKEWLVANVSRLLSIKIGFLKKFLY